MLTPPPRSSSKRIVFMTGASSVFEQPAPPAIAAARLHRTETVFVRLFQERSERWTISRSPLPPDQQQCAYLSWLCERAADFGRAGGYSITEIRMQSLVSREQYAHRAVRRARGEIWKRGPSP